MAKRRIGALIVFEKETVFKIILEQVLQWIQIFRKNFLINVFIPNTPFMMVQ